MLTGYNIQYGYLSYLQATDYLRHKTNTKKNYVDATPAQRSRAKKNKKTKMFSFITAKHIYFKKKNDKCYNTTITLLYQTFHSVGFVR